MESQKTQSTLFSNYREMHSNAIFTDEMNQVRDEVIREIDRLVCNGYNTFVIGLADMFDILVAEALNEYRDSCPELQYFVVIYKDQHLGFATGTKPRIEKVTMSADCTCLTSNKYHRNVFSLPNEYFTNSLKMSVCYHNPYGDGGVLYAYNRNNESNRVIVNIIDVFDYLNTNSPLNK